MTRELIIEGLTVKVKDCMTDVEGWLENALDVFIDGKYVGNLIEVSTKTRGLKRIIETEFKTQLNYENIKDNNG